MIRLLFLPIFICSFYISRLYAFILRSKYRTSELLDSISDNNKVSDEANIAVKAFASAAAICQLNVSCGEAKDQLIKIRTQSKVVSEATARSKKAAKKLKLLSDKTSNFIDSIKRKNKSRNRNRGKNENNNKKLAEMAVKQAEAAVQATAKAVATCELIANVTCNSHCEDGKLSTRNDKSL